jgi:hypothetical protein
MRIKGKGAPFSKYESGLSSATAIRKAIRQTWEEIIKEPNDRAKAELLLGLPPGSLSETSPVPYGIAVQGSGLTGVEAVILLVLWDFAKDLGYDILKDTAKDALIEGGKALWSGMMQKRVKAILPPKSIGREVTLADDVQ